MNSEKSDSDHVSARESTTKKKVAEKEERSRQALMVVAVTSAESSSSDLSRRVESTFLLHRDIMLFFLV